jgi:hypothetical protein
MFGRAAILAARGFMSGRNALVLALLLPACFEAHTHGAFDAAPTSDAAPLRPDTPAAPSCAPVRPLAICADSFAPDAEGVVHLPLRFEGCACCGSLACTATTTDEGWTYELSTGSCDEACTCDRCEAPTADCALAAAAAFRYEVLVDGAPALVSNGGDVDGHPFSARCATLGEPDLCAVPGEATATGIGVGGELACVHDDPAGPDDWIELRTSWACDWNESVCFVGVEPRLDGELPPGSDLYVRATVGPSACRAGCTEPRTERARRCVVPALEPGAFYRVLSFDERVIATFTAGDPAVACDD